MEIISFGGGIQTVALSLMSINGDLPKADYAIFADTGWELEETYEYISWFLPYCESKGLKFYCIDNGNIREDALNWGKRAPSMPYFTKDETGKKGILFRQCTYEYKVLPVQKAVRKIMGLKPYQKCKKPSKLLLGISTDEASRMRNSRVGYIINKYPLIEYNISRNDCINYIIGQGFPLPPKSACIGCPYHSDRFWRLLKETYPNEFDDACRFDDEIRNDKRGLIKYPRYLHASLRPLKEIDFSDNQFNLFENECEGFCGL